MGTYVYNDGVIAFCQGCSIHLCVSAEGRRACDFLKTWDNCRGSVDEVSDYLGVGHWDLSTIPIDKATLLDNVQHKPPQTGLWHGTLTMQLLFLANELHSRRYPNLIDPNSNQKSQCDRSLLGGSWVAISRVISKVTILITHFGGLITPLTYNYL